MITFSISIANPFKYKRFQTCWYRSWSVSKNRTLELQIYRYSYNLLEFGLDLRWWGSSHAGPRLELGILGYTVDISLPCNHHWDSETQDWIKHD